jgi:hypothetical protein
MCEPNTEALRAIYEQVCNAHNSIADFRAKLLALLPIASGTGIFLLLSDKMNAEAKPHLVAIGTFGALVTLGLFLYELRGIDTCNALIKCGKFLESKLMSDKSTGTFISRREAVLKGFVGITWASLVIYPTVIGTWIYVACMGICIAPGGKWAMLISVAAVVLFMVGGKVVDGKQTRQLKSTGIHAVKETSATPAA